MILFFDRDIGICLPKALQLLHFDKQFHEMHYHQQHFPQSCPDDIWLTQVGQWGWIVVGHDSQHHVSEAEISAIKQYNIGCFYMWGASATRWEKMQCFARAYERIVQAEKTTPKPFIFNIRKNGRLNAIRIP
jgi:hypothetical protein